MSVKVFLAICCSFFCSVAVSVRADLPEYCGPQNYAYTPLRKDPRGEFTLKQVHVVIRFVPSDVQNNMCYVNFYSCQLLTMFKTNNMRTVNGKSQVRSVWGEFPLFFFNDNYHKILYSRHAICNFFCFNIRIESKCTFMSYLSIILYPSMHKSPVIIIIFCQSHC